MALLDGSEKAATDRLQQARESYINVLTSSVENCRWLVTLVVAEMAGIVAYRSNVVKQQTLGPVFAVVIIVLGLSLAAFVVSVLSARFERRQFDALFGGAIAKVLDKVKSLTKDDKVAPADSKMELLKVTESAILSLPSALRTAGGSELVGVALLGIGSCLAALALFFGEISALFGMNK